MIENAFWADRKKKEKARNPHDSKLFWQGQKDSNPRHAVLETAALPAELYPYLLRLDYYTTSHTRCQSFFQQFLSLQAILYFWKNQLRQEENCAIII